MSAVATGGESGGGGGGEKGEGKERNAGEGGGGAGDGRGGGGGEKVGGGGDGGEGGGEGGGERYPVVEAVLPGSPAQIDGRIMAGDLLLSIDSSGSGQYHVSASRAHSV